MAEACALTLCVLGAPVLRRGDSSVTIGRRKALALLVYLAVTGQTHSRDALATLLWPDRGQSQARGNLRRALFQLERAIGRGLIEAQRETLRLAEDHLLQTDIGEFRRLLREWTAGDAAPGGVRGDATELLARAADLYRDDFLTGFTLPDSRQFDEWQFFQSEQLRAEAAAALRELARSLLADGRLDRAVAYARRWLAMDPLEEEAHRLLMRLYAAGGQRAAALRQYRECERILREELDCEPDPETRELRLAIERGRAGAATAFGVPGRSGDGSLGRGESTGGGPRAGRLGGEVRAGGNLSGDGTEAGGCLCASEVEVRLVTALTVGPGVVDDELPGPGRVAACAREVLARFAAHVQSGYGEDLVALFGVSASREDDPERAVLAALTILGEARELGLQAAAGLDTGLLLVPPAAGGWEPPPIWGAAVGRAARLRQVAAAGQVLVGASTFRRTRGAFSYEVCPTRWPGRPEAEITYRAIGLKEEPEKPYGLEGRPAPLMGRQAELDRLLETLGRVMEGEGQIVILIGEAGLGKSRLIRELRKRGLALAGGKAPLWLCGRCQEVGESTGYGPFLEILRGYFGLTAADSEEGRVGRIEAGLRELTEQGLLAAEELEETASLLGRLLSLRFGTQRDERLQALGPLQVRQRAFRALLGLFGTMAGRRPLALVLEDLHWADELSLELLAALMEGLPGTPLLLLCAYRPEPDHGCRNLGAIAGRRCPGRCTEITLAELSGEASRGLAAALLGQEPLPAGLAETVERRGRGNPLFIEEIVRAWSGTEPRGPSPPPAPEGVSETVLGLVQARVDRLRPVPKQTLQGAAAVGELFGREVLQRILPSRVDLGPALRELEQAGWIYQEPGTPGDAFGFRHALIQEAVYQGLPPERRTELHRRIAEAIEELCADRLEERCEAIAHHYDRAGAAGPAVEYLLQAGEKALGRCQNEQAIRSFRRALELLAAPELAGRRLALKLRALSGLGRVYYILERCEEMERCYAEAVALSESLGRPLAERIHLLYGLGHSLCMLGRIEESAAVARRGLELVGETAECAETVKMQLLLAYSYCRTDSQRSAQVSLELARYIDRLPYTEEIGMAQVEIAAACYVARRREEAQAWYERTRRQAALHHDLVTLTELCRSTCWYALLRGDLLGAMKDNLEADRFCRELGDPAGMIFTLLLQGWLHEFCGELKESLACSRRVLEELDIAEAFPWRECFGGDARRNIATAFFGLGARDEGLAYLRRTLDTYWSDVEAVQLPYLQVVNIALVAKTLLGLGEAEEAAAHLRRLFALAPHRTRHHTHQQRMGFALALGALEEAMGDRITFAAFCREYRTRYPDTEQLSLRLWHLEPVRPARTVRRRARERFPGVVSPDWSWQDPGGDGEYALAGTLEIRAANGRDLCYLNTSAPRFARPVSGSFAVQVTCSRALADRPALGGLAVWQDPDHFVCLERGSLGPGELSFRGCLGPDDRMIGRGRLAAERQWLRLEWAGGRVRALCSADGRRWFSLGEIDASFASDLQILLYASGWIDRSYYHGAFPQGGAIRFDCFALWELRAPEARERSRQ